MVMGIIVAVSVVFAGLITFGIRKPVSDAVPNKAVGCLLTIAAIVAMIPLSVFIFILCVAGLGALAAIF